MRWVTPIWMSAVLVVATTALHLTTEHTLQIDQTAHSNTKQHIVNSVNSSEEFVKNMARNLIVPDTSSSPTINKSVEAYRNSVSEASEASKGRSNKYSESTGAITELGLSATSDQDMEETEPSTVEEQSTTITSETGGNSEGEEEQATTSPSDLDDTIVETSTGRVRGNLWRGKTNILSYIDIKYGTIKNRFEAPVFPEADETSIHDEKAHNIRCPQLQGDRSVGVPDCLTLSIFKPYKKELSDASVLVHIHEGNFINESANPEIYGPEYLISEDIILVLPNYRLGPLGFLCLQNETAHGNAALKDLALALRWIKENIKKFGGDPDNITVSGEGTAGALAGYLALSPMSQNNVKKVISESGSVLSPWAIDRNPSSTAMDLASRVTGPWASWETIDIQALLLAARGIAWRPCLENNTVNVTHFMVETPWVMLQKKEINITFMIGSAEYAGVHESLNHTASSIELLSANNSLLLPNDLKFETVEDMSRVGSRVKAHYFSEAEISLNNVKNRTLYYTDMAYLGPALRTARSLVNSGSTVYFYEFSFVGDLNIELAAIEKQVDGAVRGDIIGYLFYQGEMSDIGDKEKNMIELMIQLWTSFLKTGTPKAEGIEWKKFEKVTAAQEQLLSIKDKTETGTGVHVERLQLWTEIYDEHFIDRSLALGISPSVYTVLFLQALFFITFFKNAGHFF